MPRDLDAATRDAGAVIEQPRLPTFVGRADELAAIDGLLNLLPQGLPALAIVTGEAGVGKSRLVGELQRRANGVAGVIATGYTSSDGATLPYGSIVSLIGDLGRQVPDEVREQLIEPLQQQLLGSAEVLSRDGRIAHVQVLDNARRVIDQLADDGPVVLVVEDLHWADTGSVELLDYLARNLRDLPVLIALTYRPEEVDRRPAIRRVFVELRRLPMVAAFDLGGLHRDDVAALLYDVTGEEQSWAVIDAVHRRSEGNPLFAQELVRVHGSSSLPPALRDLLALRIEQLYAEPRATVAAAAILGPCDYRLLALVADVNSDELDGAIADAVRQGVLVTNGTLGTVGFRHALLREAAQAELLPTERTRLHRRAAEAIANDPALAPGGAAYAAAALGEHWFEAGEWAEACSASIAAAEASMRVYALHAASAHWRRAIEAHRRAAGRCTHSGVDDVELYLKLAETAGLIGELTEAFTAAEQAVGALDDDGGPSDRAAAAFVAVAGAAWDARRSDVAFAAIAEAEARLNDASRGRAAAEVVSMHARLLMITGQNAACIERCEHALALARAAGARDIEAQTLATLGPCLVDQGDFDGALETMQRAVAIAQEVGTASVIMRAYGNYSHVLGTWGRFEDTAAISLDAVREGGPLAVMRLGGVGYNGLEALVMLGRWDEADELSDVIEGKARAACMHTTVVPAEFAIRRGELDAAERDLERRTALSGANEAQHHNVLAQLELARGRPEVAAAHTERALETLAGTDFLIDILTAHALGLQALADQYLQPVRPSRRKSADPAKTQRIVESTLAVVDEQLVANTRGGSVSPWAAALHALCRAEATRVLGADPAAWVTAADAWESLSAPYHVAYCRFREAEARLTTRADRRLARDPLINAWTIAHRLGARVIVDQCARLAERARIELGNSPAATSPRELAAADLALTTREVEVLDLLARGRTDAQIADELFVSKKTASVHVSNVVRKLDARDRYHAGEIGINAGLGATS